MNFTIAAQMGDRQDSILADIIMDKINIQKRRLKNIFSHRLCLKRVMKAASAFIGTSFLAACSSVVPPSVQAPVSAPVTAAAVNVVATDSDRHRVALLLPISGRDGDVGQEIANATTLALLDTKSSNIRMTTYDTANGVEAAAQQAIADGNKLILGPLRGDNVVKVANFARPANIPIISFSNDVSVAGQNVFLMGHLPNQSIERIVRFAQKRGKTRFAGLVPKNVFGQRALSNLTSSVRNAGGTLVTIQEYDSSRSSIESAAKRIANLGNVDAVLIADGGRRAAIGTSYLRQHGLQSAQIMGTDRWNVDNSLVTSSTMRGAWFASVADSLYRQYADNYNNRFGKRPLRLSSLGYDSVLLVARVARDWQVGSNFPVTMLTDPGGFIGVDGAFRFLPNGKSERMLEVQEVRQGQYVTIDAAPRNFAQ